MSKAGVKKKSGKKRRRDQRKANNVSAQPSKRAMYGDVCRGIVGKGGEDPAWKWKRGKRGWDTGEKKGEEKEASIMGKKK